MIEKYWSEMFGEFEISPGQFDIPNFPEPLLSVHFGKRNMIAQDFESAALRFHICEFHQEIDFKSKMPYGIESLNQALEGKNFWNFQKSQGPETFDFMSRFLPFAAASEREYLHFFIEREGELAASAIVGIAPSGALIFNGLVARKCREQGLAKELFGAVRDYLKCKPLFYWTLHPYLRLGADKVYTYQLLN